MKRGQDRLNTQGTRRRLTFLFVLLCLVGPGLWGCRVWGIPGSIAPAKASRTPTLKEAASEQAEIPLTSTPTETVSPTDTLEPTATSTPTATPSATAVPPTATVASTSTFVPTATHSPTPLAPSPTPPCVMTPQWGLGDVWNNPEVKARLGCPLEPQHGIQGEEMYFQHGHMLWRPDEELIYVLRAPFMENGWGAFADTYGDEETVTPDPDLVPPTPRVGAPKLYQPIGRFGKLWLENPWMEEKLGWTVQIPGSEGDLVRTFSGAVQDFEHGVLFWNRNVCFVLFTDDMSWTIY